MISIFRRSYDKTSFYKLFLSRRPLIKRFIVGSIDDKSLDKLESLVKVLNKRHTINIEIIGFDWGSGVKLWIDRNPDLSKSRHTYYLLEHPIGWNTNHLGAEIIKDYDLYSRSFLLTNPETDLGYEPKINVFDKTQVITSFERYFENE
tara:strand:- start:1465 stop:1908 length:444 start_codon:yes stop_codon:yes gene_type:complete